MLRITLPSPQTPLATSIQNTGSNVPKFPFQTWRKMSRKKGERGGRLELRLSEAQLSINLKHIVEPEIHIKPVVLWKELRTPV